MFKISIDKNLQNCQKKKIREKRKCLKKKSTRENRFLLKSMGT